MAEEEIKAVLNDFAVAAVERSRAEAAAMVNHLFASMGSDGLERVLAGMTTSESLAFGQTLSAGWETSNMANAARVAGQKRALAKVLTALINAGAASLMAEMN